VDNGIKKSITLAASGLGAKRESAWFFSRLTHNYYRTVVSSTYRENHKVVALGANKKTFLIIAEF
jgi:hypothetical protein